MISYIHRLVFGPQAIIEKINLADFGVPECTRCHAHLRSGYALSLMGHLSLEHKMGEDQAIDAAIRMLELTRKRKVRS